MYVYGMFIRICICMAFSYVYVYVGVHVYMQVLNSALTDLYISQYDDVPGKLIEHFARQGLVQLVLYVG